MSAFKYLVFTMGVVLVAVFGSILLKIINPILDLTAQHSTTAASSTGLKWANSFMDFFALVLLGLLVFGLLVAIVNRRQQVVR